MTKTQMMKTSKAIINIDHRGYHGRNRKFTTMLSRASKMAVTRPQTCPVKTAMPTASPTVPSTR